MNKWIAILLFLTPVASARAAATSYVPRGVGGGGAMAAYSISPYSPLRFVGTDMGTLFRSTDSGKHWQPISQSQITVHYDLALAGSVGFSPDGETVFYATEGKHPKRSTDEGVTWKAIPVPLDKEEHIRYWASDREDPDFLLCATDRGVYRTTDKGLHWEKSTGVSSPAAGTFVQKLGPARIVYHATDREVLLSRDGGKSFAPWFTPEGTGIHAFAGGADDQGVTLALIDSNGAQACAWAGGPTDHWRKANLEDCGYVWIHRGDGPPKKPAFHRTSKDGGRFVRMAENDSKTIWVTAGDWIRQTGSKVWVSNDRGESWDLRFLLYDWDKSPYAPWPADKLEYSAVGLDVGWNDNAYFSFEVNPLNSSEAGGTGHYFLHTTLDQGRHWKSPFTEYRDSGPRAKGKRWSSTGLEVTTVLKLKFHPTLKGLGYAGLSDVSGYVTEDGGETWRITRSGFNAIYDYAFDPAEKDLVFAAAGNQHDFPLGNNGATEASGAILRSTDRGRSWTRLTPDAKPWNRQFVSIAYDPIHKILYGGTQGGGIARSKDQGKTWEALNSGLPNGALIIPQLEVDPKNGNVYALVGGDAPKFTNRESTGIYFLDLSSGTDRWQLLRGTLMRPHGLMNAAQLWWYPSAFAIDWSRPKRDVLWLADMEAQGAWLATGIWKSTDRGASWDRMHQFTHPSAVVLDPEDPDTVYAAGTWNVDGSWGEGGPLYSHDGGRTWKKNREIPFQGSLSGVRPDPGNPGKIFYLFFGGGMVYGPKP